MAYYFRLPSITDLTKHQQYILYELEPIAISGGAGTGKTVVSLYRHLLKMRDFNKTTVLVTYTKTLGFYLQMTLEAIEDKNIFQEKNMLPPSQQVFIIKNFPFNQNWKVSEIIIDEAQDLTLETLQKITVHGDLISYGADFNQQLYEGRATENEIKELFPNNEERELLISFRNSYHILNFVKSLFPNFAIDQNSLNLLLNGDPDSNPPIKENIGIKPKLLITENSDIEINKIVEIINSFKSNTHNIAILLPFGSSGEESVENYHTLLSSINIDCSKYYNEMRTDNIEISNIHVTTYKSAKGLEFDTVIIPFINKFRDFINRSRATRVNEEDYYVAFTRTKSNLYLFSNQELEFISSSLCDINKVDNSAIIPIAEDEIPF
ncbi:MAG: 3'-5' exonuclease [Candidatus Gracilibacteria bacterium]